MPLPTKARLDSGLAGRRATVSAPWLTELARGLLRTARSDARRAARRRERGTSSTAKEHGVNKNRASQDGAGRLLGVPANGAGELNSAALGLGEAAGVNPIWLRCQLAASLKELSPNRRRWVLFTSRAGIVGRVARLIGSGASREVNAEFARRVGGSGERLLASLAAVAGRAPSQRGRWLPSSGRTWTNQRMAGLASAAGAALVVGLGLGHATATFDAEVFAAEPVFANSRASRLGTAGVRGGAFADRARLRAAELRDASARLPGTHVGGQLMLADGRDTSDLGAMLDNAVVVASSSQRSAIAPISGDGTFEFAELDFGYWRLDLVATGATARTVSFRLASDAPRRELDLLATVHRVISVHVQAGCVDDPKPLGMDWLRRPNGPTLVATATRPELGARVPDDWIRAQPRPAGVREADRASLIGLVDLPRDVSHLALVFGGRVVAAADVPIDALSARLRLSAPLARALGVDASFPRIPR